MALWRGVATVGDGVAVDFPEFVFLVAAFSKAAESQLCCLLHGVPLSMGPWRAA